MPVVQVSALKALECGCGKRDCKWCGKIWNLMDAMDNYIPTPVRPKDKPFLMPVEDVFSIKGSGTVATGRVERGVVKVGEEVEIVGCIKPPGSQLLPVWKCSISCWTSTEPGDAVGALLRGVEREDIERGQVLAEPGSIKPHTEANAEIYVLRKEEGGRHTPFFTGYKPQFYIRTTDVTGEIILPEGVEMVMPGDSLTSMTIKTMVPVVMEEGLRFAVREGGRTVGAGVITKVLK